MNKTEEFQDTAIDRAAVAAILTAAGRTHGAADDLAQMNASWDVLARNLAAAPDEVFQDWRDRLDTLTRDRADVRGQVEGIVAHLIGWRLGDV